MKTIALILAACLTLNISASLEDLNQVLDRHETISQRFKVIGECEVEFKVYESLNVQSMISRTIISKFNLSTISKTTLKLEKDGVIFFTNNFDKTISVDVKSYDNVNDELIQYAYETSALKIRVQDGPDFLANATLIRDYLFESIASCE